MSELNLNTGTTPTPPKADSKVPSGSYAKEIVPAAPVDSKPADRSKQAVPKLPTKKK